MGDIADHLLPAGVTLGAMTADEVGILRDWAAAEGWNPGLHDVDVAWRDQPSSFVALRRDGELVGGGSIVSYGRAWGFMGLFIVRGDLRGAGLGTALWHYRRDALLARLAEPAATIGMDGVFAMQPFYARGGFRFAHRTLRFEGPAAGEPDSAVDVVSGASMPTALVREVVAFDELHAIGPRPGFMRAWLTVPGVRIALVRDRGGLTALGALRPCRVGWKYGPVLAIDADDGARVVAALAAEVPGELVQLDVPEPNEAALATAAALGLVESFGCARMYHGRMPELPLHRIFGVTSFEFG